jgi:hypothetical protein
MNGVSFARLNTLSKELTKQSQNLISCLFPQFVITVDIFKYIFANIDSNVVPFYFIEYCVKIASILDVIETLEFGRLRSKHLTAVHEKFISPDKMGGFMISPRPCEKDLRLTTCSHEGLAYLFNIHEVKKMNNILIFVMLMALPFFRKNKIRTLIPLNETISQINWIKWVMISSDVEKELLT